MRGDMVQNTEQMTAAVSKFGFYCCDQTLSKSNLRKKKEDKVYLAYRLQSIHEGKEDPASETEAENSETLLMGMLPLGR